MWAGCAIYDSVWKNTQITDAITRVLAIGDVNQEMTLKFS